ncbi:hypothetical protein [Kibdelosporangium aridum]|uniref:Uncharacterized protein n=1 Tax=Kibdelosporangium aridum TaxID=2030 RepID=A0A1Y5XUB8_KIBAR|nr:hypothetical protein [Kibdelosporangium aridum]SMD13706.1 hypothetical protein SAMN05661093_04905 [Kibdelosporangium aridum]
MKRLLVLVGLLLAIAPTAEASEPQNVDVSVTPAGFEAPRAIRAGAVTFRVRSSDPEGAWLGLVQPRVPLRRYLDDLERAMGDDPVEGGKDVLRDAEMLGGVAVAAVPASVTLRVTPGDYYLVDFRDVGKPDLASRVRPVRVVPGHAGSMPRVSTQITLTDGKFLAPRVIEGPVRVVNLSRQHNEAMLMPVRPGTTLADLDAFFTGVGPYPFTGGPTGVVPMTPGRSAILSTTLPPGEYALVTWVYDLRTGKMFAAQGMRSLIAVKG